MLKKAFGVVMAVAFIFSLAPQTSKIASSVSKSCYCACCDHDGDVWSN